MSDADLRKGDLKTRFDALFLPAYFSPQAYLEGYGPGTYPPEMTGGMGVDGIGISTSSPEPVGPSSASTSRRRFCPST